NWWIEEKPERHLFKTVLRLALLPIRFFNEPLLRSEPAAACSVVLYVVPFLLLRRRPRMLLWGLLLTFTVALVLATDLSRTSRQLEFLRYTIAASPAIYAIVASLVKRP